MTPYEELDAFKSECFELKKLIESGAEHSRVIAAFDGLGFSYLSLTLDDGVYLDMAARYLQMMARRVIEYIGEKSNDHL